MVAFQGVGERTPSVIDADADCAVRRFLLFRSAISWIQLDVFKFVARATAIKAESQELLKRSFVARHKTALLTWDSIGNKAMRVKRSREVLFGSDCVAVV